MKKIISIMMLNLIEAVRDKLFWGVAVFFAFYLFFCAFLGELTAGYMAKVMRNWGLIGVELSSVILVLSSFIFSYYREKSSRIQEVYFTNMSRTAYITGKLLGFVLISFCYLFLSGVALSAALLLFKSFDPAVAVAIYPIFLKLTILTGFVGIACYIFTSAPTALFMSLCIYLLCVATPSTLGLVNSLGSGVQKTLIGVFYTLLPNMDKLDIRYLAVWGRLPQAGYFVAITFYTLAYFLLLWLINIFFFQKK
jgi:hypothetical protein